MMKIVVKWKDSEGVPHFNNYSAEGGYLFDKDLGDFNDVEYIMIREVKDKNE